MREVWDGLPALVQDISLLIGLLLPALILGVILIARHRPLPLVRAMIWRFRWANVLFVALIAVSVGVGVALLAQERGLRIGSAKAADKFDMIVSAPGSDVTMMMAAVFLQPTDVELIGGDVYTEIDSHPRVAVAAPLAFGDSWQGAPVVGTTAGFIAHLTDGALSGPIFTNHMQAVIGARVPLDIGASFTPAHGHGAMAEDVHDTEIEVIARMPFTGSPWDKAILVPVESVWETHGLADGHSPENAGRIGPPFDADYFPGTPAIIVHATELWANYALRSEFNRAGETMAFFPGAVLARLYGLMGDVRQAMSVMSLVSQGLVAVSVLAGLMILTRIFAPQLALLRALGAPPRFIAATVWSYATGLILFGAILGIGVGYLASLILSRIVTARTDILILPGLGWPEVHLVAGFVSLAAFFALAPACIALLQRVIPGLRR